LNRSSRPCGFQVSNYPIPNYRAVSANAHLPSLSFKNKFWLATEDTFDYSNFIFVGGLAGISMASKSEPSFGHGGAGYGRYYWHIFADGDIENYMTEAIVPGGDERRPDVLHVGKRWILQAHWLRGKPGCSSPEPTRENRPLIFRRSWGQERPRASAMLLLAGLLRAPALYSPFKNPDMALQRRNKVLEAMAARGKLNVTEVATAMANPIVTRSLGNTEVKPLPDGVLHALAADESEYCGEFEGDFKKGCEETFRINLRWRELLVEPRAVPAVLVENSNIGFCGSAGCALRLFVERADGQFAQALGTDGEVGSLDEVEALKAITDGHYDIQKTWADGRTHTIYRWRGSRYSAD
jgi:hypothetical protein